MNGRVTEHRCQCSLCSRRRRLWKSKRSSIQIRQRAKKSFANSQSCARHAHDWALWCSFLNIATHAQLRRIFGKFSLGQAIPPKLPSWLWSREDPSRERGRTATGRGHEDRPNGTPEHRYGHRGCLGATQTSSEIRIGRVPHLHKGDQPDYHPWNAAKACP